MVQNKGLILKSIPKGFPVPGKDLVTESRELDLDTAAPEGGLILKNHVASFDPYLRGKMRDPNIKSYSQPILVGTVVPTYVVGTVVKTKNQEFKEGDLVSGMAGIEEYTVISAETANLPKFVKLDNPYKLDPKYFIGPLGMPGLTAYSSFYAIGKPKKNETIFISAASGAVGQIVGQLAKHEGLKVIGSVGDDAKLEFILKEIGYDSGFNYKKEKTSEALKRLAPDGIDIYYENVGGETLQAAFDHLKVYGRIIVSGMVSTYNMNPADVPPLKNVPQFIGKRIKMQGFVVGDPDMGPLYTVEHQKNVQKWLADGSFKAKLSETDGIDNAASGFVGMLEGKNFGKAFVTIASLEKA